MLTFFRKGFKLDNILTLAGQIGVDANGKTPEDIKGQMVICYDNIKNVLKEFDCTLITLLMRLGL